MRLVSLSNITSTPSSRALVRHPGSTLAAHRREARRARGFSVEACHLFAVAVLTAGCASEGVDLGGGSLSQDLRRGDRCRQSPLLDQDVLVTNQAELDALRGCEEIRGALRVQKFAGADLGALSALRAVGAGLLLGTSELDLLSLEEWDDAARVNAIAEREAALTGTWLTSLSGLEALERVGELGIFGTALTDLEGFERLSELDASEAASDDVSGGLLNVQENPNLRDLRGLEDVRGIVNIGVGFNDSLESLAGLTLGSTLIGVSLFASPALVDIGALSPVRFATIAFDGIGVVDLAALSSLEGGDSIDINNNAALRDASGLSAVQEVRSVTFMGNAALVALPRFSALQFLPDAITVVDNAALERVELDASLAFPTFVDLPSGSWALGVDVLQISDNPSLRSITLVAPPVDFSGLTAAEGFIVQNNTALESIDFGGLSRVDVLALTNNTRLVDVALGALSTVDSLLVTNNTALDAAVFGSVRTFERVIEGNASDAL